MSGLQATDVEKVKSLTGGRKQIAERCERSELNEPMLVRRIARREHNFIYPIDIPER